MRIRRFLLSLFVLSFLFHPIALAQDDALRVVGTVPLPGDPVENQIVLFFDAPISLEGGEDASAWFSVEPYVSGERRIGANFVSFKPDDPNQESILRIRLADTIQSESGAALAEEDRAWTFANFRFEPNNLWLIEESAQQIVFGLWYPVPVQPEVQSEHLRVTTAGGAAVEYTVESSDDPQVLRVVIPGGTQWPVNVTAQAGMTDRDGEFTQARDRTFTYPESAVLAVNHVDWGEYTENRQTVVLDFSREVDGAALRERLALRDTKAGQEVPYTLLSDEAQSVHVAELDLADPSNVTLQVTIEEGLAGAQETTLPETFERTLGQSPRPLVISYHYWNYAGKEGYSLYVNLSQPVNVASLREHITFDPALPDMRIEPQGDQQFQVYGQWDSKTTYTMTLEAGLKYWVGATLDTAITRDVTTEETPAYLGFGYEGKYYFPRRSGGEIPVESRNLTRANATLYRVFPSNLLVALDDLNAGSPDPSFISRWSEQVASRELMLAVKPDRLVTTGLVVDELVPDDQRGVFCIAVDSQKTSGARKVVVLTDLAALAHWNNDALSVYVHHLINLSPASNAKVTVYSYKNQRIGEGQTDAQGIVRFDAFAPDLGDPRLAVIEAGNDFTFLELKDRDDTASAFDGSMPVYDAESYEAFVYADRDLYRPGETVHLHWTVRENYGDAVANVPLQLRIRKPNGRIAQTETITTSQYGAAGFDFGTEKVSPTGSWQAEVVVPGSESVLGTYTFRVEDFVPNRIEAEVRMDAERLRAGEQYGFTVHADHLFGAPAANRKTEATVYLERTQFESDAWNGFVFGNDSEYEPDPIELGEKETNEEGDASFTFTYAKNPEVTFPLTATVVGRVFELGGRAVSDRVERTLLPADVLLGVSASAATGGGVEVFAAAIQPDESPAALNEVKVTLEKEDWRYNVRRYYDGYEPYWIREFTEVETRAVPLDQGRGSTVFDVSGYGYYRVRVHSEATPQFSTAKFYAYGGQVELVDSARPSLIKLTKDKETYRPGETATIRIESPFDGRALVTLIGPALRDLPPIEISGKTATVEVPLTAEHVPNLWVEVTAIHTTETVNDGSHPYASHARINLPCPAPDRQLQVAFAGVPEEILPSQTLDLTVSVRDNGGQPAQAEVTVAAVDEGIHLITDYETPDPYEWLMRSRRPVINRAHYYDHVAYDFGRVAIGGDGVGRALEKRMPYIGENWIKPVALWSGTVVTNPDGTATVSFDVPEFTGTLRLVAVANGARAVGAEDEEVLVRRPYMLQTSMPRFLITGDVTRCLANVFNHTEAPVTVNVQWEASGALSGSGAQVLEIGAGNEASTVAEITASSTYGQGTLQWTAEVRDANGELIETLSETAPIPVRPPGTYETKREIIVVPAGATRTLENAAFIDDERTTWEVNVSASPAMRVQNALAFLVDYPYGCIEQTVSRLMPLYLMRQEAALVGSVLEDGRNYESYIQSGIDRIFAMQTGSGGIAFWPGGDAPHEYASVYALHFLNLVNEEQEFDVPDAALDALRSYVRGIASNWNQTGTESLYLRAYAIYALSLGGDLGALLQIDRFASLPIPETSRQLLAAALAEHTNDADRVAMFRNGPVQQYAVKETQGNFNSEMRNEAIELMALRALDAPAQELAEQANKLISYLESDPPRTTQEMSFIVSALGQYLGDLAENLDQAGGTIVGPGGQETVSGRELYESTFEGAGGAYTIQNTGDAPLFVSLTLGGVPLEPNTEALAEGIALERRYFTSEGAEYESNSYAQGSTYVVELRFETEQDLNYVVVADRLPAGFEIENPRLDATALPPGEFEEGLEASHLEIRDDRLVAVFENLPAGETRFYYAVRAVTPGNYNQPPATTEAMYAPEHHGATAPRDVVVE